MARSTSDEVDGGSSGGTSPDESLDEDLNDGANARIDDLDENLSEPEDASHNGDGGR